MTNVIEMKTATTLDIPVDRMLSNIQEEGYDQAIVIGLRGDDVVLHGSSGDVAETLLALEVAKQHLMDSICG